MTMKEMVANLMATSARNLAAGEPGIDVDEAMSFASFDVTTGVIRLLSRTPGATASTIVVEDVSKDATALLEAFLDQKALAAARSERKIDPAIRIGALDLHPELHARAKAGEYLIVWNLDDAVYHRGIGRHGPEATAPQGIYRDWFPTVPESIIAQLSNEYGDGLWKYWQSASVPGSKYMFKWAQAHALDESDDTLINAGLAARARALSKFGAKTPDYGRQVPSRYYTNRAHR